MKELIIIIATILAIVGNVPYLIDIIKGRVKPHPYTWFVWSIVSAIAFFGLVAKGAGLGAIPTASSEIFTVLIFFFSIRHGFKNINHMDTLFLVIALLGLIPWFITKDPTISIIIAVSIDVMAFIPTLTKTWYRPDTEISVLYSMNVFRHILTLFALDAFNIATTLHSFAMIVTNTIMTLFIIRHVKKNPGRHLQPKPYHLQKHS